MKYKICSKLHSRRKKIMNEMLKGVHTVHVHNAFIITGNVSFPTIKYYNNNILTIRAK